MSSAHSPFRNARFIFFSITFSAARPGTPFKTNLHSGSKVPPRLGEVLQAVHLAGDFTASPPDLLLRFHFMKKRRQWAGISFQTNSPYTARVLGPDPSSAGSSKQRQPGSLKSRGSKSLWWWFFVAGHLRLRVYDVSRLCQQGRAAAAGWGQGSILSSLLSYFWCVASRWAAGLAPWVTLQASRIPTGCVGLAKCLCMGCETRQWVAGCRTGDRLLALDLAPALQHEGGLRC